jgi:hypothetical protein
LCRHDRATFREWKDIETPLQGCETRSRSTVELPTILLTAAENSLSLQFAAGWLANNPLTVADLEREKLYLQDVGCRLDFL